MNLVCAMLGHKRSATKDWDGEFYHSACSRCGTALVRLSGDRDWRLPDACEKRYFALRQAQAPAAEAESP